MIEKLPLKVWAASEHRANDSYLVKAAIKHEVHVYTGWRHSVIIQHMTRIGLDLGSPSVAADAQGFVDQHGVFYGRYRAARIALHAKQIVRIPPMLTSEDLWDDDGTPREVGKPYNPVGDRQAVIDRAAEWRDQVRR